MATLYTPSNPPKKNTAFAVQICLQDMANPGSFKANPTIATGDFKASGASNGGSPSAVGNLTVLPSVDPSGSIWVNLQLSASEMNYDQVFVQCIDQTSPKEWADYSFCINTAPAQYDANVTQLGGNTQSATDLKDFADTGYDPSTHKVTEVLLVDTTTNSTNAPSSGDLTSTMKTSVTTAATAATPTAAAVTGDVGGKVIGGGSGTITGTGARVVDGSGNAVAPASSALSTATWTSARAGYLDNLNVGGAVASHADVAAINQSASKHLLMQTVGQYERPESGTTVYTVELRTFSASTGAAVNADSTPTITATGQTSGSLSANLSAVSNPATGVYRATYTVSSGDTNEPIRFDGSATISSSTFTLSCYSQVVDLVSTTWTSTDATHLTAIYNKLPSKSYLGGTDNSSGALEASAFTGNFAGSVGSINGVTFPSGFETLAINSGGVTTVLLGTTSAQTLADMLSPGSFTASFASSTFPVLNTNVVSISPGMITDSSFTTPSEAAGRPTGVLSMIRRIFEWAVNKRTRNRGTGIVTLRNAADSGDLESQTQSTTGDTDTQTKGV